MPPKLTPEIISAAIVGFEQQKRRIDDQIAELRAMLPGGRTDGTAATLEAPGRKRQFSTAARRKMRDAQRLRWAKIRGESGPSAPAEAPKPKRKLSAVAKAKLVANLKKARAAKAAKAKTAAAKRAAPALKKTKAKKAAVRTAPARAAKRSPVKKAAKKMAPAPASTVAETAAQ